MSLIVNIVAAATDLAHQALKDDVMTDSYSGTICKKESDLYETDECKEYKDEYQTIFNDHYDYFFKIISNHLIL